MRSMQALGVISFLFCVVCMYCIFRNWTDASYIIFAISTAAFMASLIISLLEIFLSTKALELELSDMEKETRVNFFTNILGVRDGREQE
ncbi:DUF2721 domain-containing protein [Paraflavitalea speifideaquila]|uniref:DUF2721 domain-containing protein n=1 Tax=Paraflavitalea speifideaquila TaxID=3076558 RepID=UPI0028E6BB92|nr:DUF2721 domain-containing protein [Paraflavitalea speifideiaquila]